MAWSLQFAQVLFSLEAYLLAPYVRRYVHQASVQAHIGLAVVMSVAAGMLLWDLSSLLTAVFAISLLSITFVFPW